MRFNTKDITYYNQPFDHWVLDNFLDINDAKKLSNQFIDFDKDLHILNAHCKFC